MGPHSAESSICADLFIKGGLLVKITESIAQTPDVGHGLVEDGGVRGIWEVVVQGLVVVVELPIYTRFIGCGTRKGTLGSNTVFDYTFGEGILEE